MHLINSPTIEQFTTALESIGWTLDDCGCNLKRLRRPNGKSIEMILSPGGTIRSDHNDSEFTLCIDLANCYLRRHEKDNRPDCYSLGPIGDPKGNTVFVQFYNYG